MSPDDLDTNPTGCADLFALWPDTYMCLADEVEEMLRPPCARSDDFEWVIVTEYDGTGSPSKWVPKREWKQ